MYATAIKNKDKKEFDWDTNQSCIDFHLIINGISNYYYSGSYCANEFEYYNENHCDDIDTYSLTDFKIEAERTIKKFLNRKNKKEYEIDNHLETLAIVLWDYDKNDYETLKLNLNLTYCP